jgi:hypothetical protein
MWCASLLVPYPTTRRRCAPAREHAQLLENENCRALAHHEAVAVLVERTRRRGGIVVARGHRADDRERAIAQRREGRFGRAGEHDVGVVVADRAERVADGDGARRAAHRVAAVRAHRADLDRDVAARGAAEHAERETRLHGADALREEDAELLFGEADAAERTAHHHADALAVLAGEIETGVLQRLLRAGDGEGAVAVEPLHLLALHEVRGVEVVQLGRVVAAIRRSIEPGDAPHRRSLRAESAPQRLSSQSNRRHRADSRHRHPPPVSHVALR